MRRFSGHCPPEKRSFYIDYVAIAALVVFLLAPWEALWAGNQEAAANSASGISKAAADKCGKKIKSLQEFGISLNPQEKKTTEISQDEANSYLALELSSKFGASLKSLLMTFEEGRMQIAADIDFDALGTQSGKGSEKLMAAMISGIHKLTATGKLNAENGEAYFRLDEARFDARVLPNFLIEEIITAVGRRQNPPFNPLQPSIMPYHIQKVDVRAGTVVIHQ
jgi:hypothetical protein